MTEMALKTSLARAIARWRVRLRRALGSPGYVARELRNRFRRLHLWDYHFWRDGRALRPELLTFILTYRCNLRCRHCFLYEVEERKETLSPFTFRREEEMSLEQWQRIVNQVASFKPHVQLVGGEPFLRQDAVALIRHVKRRGLTCAANSNGYFTPAWAEELVRAGLDWLTLSLDGPRDAHTATRVNPRSFDRVMETVAAVRAARRRLGRTTPILSFNTVITDLTYTRLREVVELAEEAGVDQLEFQGLMFTSLEIERRQRRVMQELFDRPAASVEGFENDCGTGIDVDRLVAELDALHDVSTNGLALRFHPVGLLKDPRGYHDLNHPFDWAQDRPFDWTVGEPFTSTGLSTSDKLRTAPVEPQDGPFARRCTAPWREMQILPNGDVSACFGLPEMRVGSVIQDGFLAVWNGEKMRRFRRKLKAAGLFPACARCCRRDW